MSSIRINLTRTGCCVLFSALALICSLPSYAGTEEVSLYSMSTWSSEYYEKYNDGSIGWNASYDPATKTISYEAAWNQIGWNMHWKWIDASTTEFSVEFAEATTASGEIHIRYIDNDKLKTKQFNFASGVTSATCDLLSGFEDSDNSNSFQILYISIKYGATSLQLKRAYFTTTGNSDVYQAENADYQGAELENLTSADNSIVPITEGAHYVDFTINVPYAAVYRLNIGYCTKGYGAKDGQLTINNGGSIRFTFTGTGASEVKEVAYSTVLQAGYNHVKISAEHTYFYIDYLRVYEPTLYLLGENHGTTYTSAPNRGALMTFDRETETFSITTRIGKGDKQATAANFYFATVLAENADGWSYMNGHRWGPDAENTNVITDGNTEITNIAKRGSYSYLVPMAGTYTITMKADLSSFTIQGPEVYMFGLFEGAGYTWAANKFTMMTYDAANEVYRLRTRIADGAATTAGNGAVAFATAYCSTSTDADWLYLNANRYGPETTGTPSVDGTVNAIGLHGDKAFNNIPARKYEVVVDMFSATKTARFYPLYTFGYEVVGTYKHGSIVCSTSDTEIPLNGTPTVTAVPDAGYRFVKWTDGSNVQLSTSAEYTHTITANTWLKAWFEPDPSCKLTIPANTFAFAKHGDNIYSAADNNFLYEDNTGKMYFNSTYNDGSELFYPVHLNAGTYFFYCTLNGEGTERKMRLYAHDEESGTLLYSGKKWSLADTASHNFDPGAATFETKGFTVTTGDYLIALYAKGNTRFSQIEVVGAAGGATTNTVALTLSAGSNGSVISDQINNAKILSGTEVLLLAEPDDGYRFQQWSDGSTDNPRTVTMTEALSLTASFNQTNGCLNTLTRECESDAVTPSTAPVAVPTVTEVSGGRIIDKNEDRMLYYAFEITEPVTASFTLLTATSDKSQQLYLYSKQENEGTALVYNTVTYHQLGDPVAVNSPNSGYNHVYPVSSGAVSLAAGKYVVGLYSEVSWSQYDRLVLSAGANDIDCSNADITIYDGETVTLPHVVHNLTVYQGGAADNTHDVKVLNEISYIRPAYEEAEGGNKMNKWYPFCLPFAPKSQAEGGCQVYDEKDKEWFNINPIYLKSGDDAGSPSGAGYFYLKYLTNDYTGVQPDEFRNRWAYIGQNMPAQYVPYIILFVNHWDDTNTDDDYFEQNPVVKFTGGAQTIEGTAKIDPIPAENVEKYFYYANNTLAPIHLESAYVYDPSRNNFDYKENVNIPPFECYIQATESFKALHRSIAMPRVGQIEDTATATDYTPNNNDCRSYIFDITGRLIDNNAERLPRGVYICKQGNETRKLIIY